MYAVISKTHFEIIVINSGQLLFYNTFEYTTKEDFIYYLLFTAEQLQLNPEEFKLTLIGNLTANSELYKIAYTYVRNVTLFDVNKNYNLENGVQEECLSNFVLINSI